jgi:glycine dehydrogenase subunit 2
MQPLLFELSDAGQINDYLPPLDVPATAFEYSLRDSLPLPEVDEHSIVRHYTRLSHKNFSIDTEFYPLGSCTMKYNPKINEVVASMPGFAQVHPLQDESSAQGWLEVLYEAQRVLAQIAGLHAATVQPLAGAQGEFCGLLMIRAYHQSRGEGTARTRIVVPDSAHGTNPASAARCGYSVTSVASNEHGCVDLEAMQQALGADVAAVMITNPNTLGVFEKDIEKLCAMAHDAGALVYMDGANMNAILGVVRPGDTGVDVMHFNVHKTFSTPHGGGGPGAGPVAVRDILEPFLPAPLVVKSGAGRNGSGEYSMDWDRPQSIGQLHAFWGNAGIVLRALTYILRHGDKGLKEISENAVLSANYVLARLRGTYATANENICKHECVLSASELKAKYGVTAWDIAKRLPDYGFHAPTVYFPTIVKESLMIEPTETETKATLDEFCDAMLKIAEEAAQDADLLHHAPHNLGIGRLDEANAARCLNLCWAPPQETCESNGEVAGEATREVPQASTY